MDVEDCSAGRIVRQVKRKLFLDICRRGVVRTETKHKTSISKAPTFPPYVLFVSFVTRSWRGHETDAKGANRRKANGCLGDACCRLLAALVLTTTMHPGTLIADLGADPTSGSPMVSCDRRSMRISKLHCAVNKNPLRDR